MSRRKLGLEPSPAVSDAAWDGPARQAADVIGCDALSPVDAIGRVRVAIGCSEPTAVEVLAAAEARGLLSSANRQWRCLNERPQAGPQCPTRNEPAFGFLLP